jgi:diamine N-acetyltransferase
MLETGATGQTATLHPPARPWTGDMENCVTISSMTLPTPWPPSLSGNFLCRTLPGLSNKLDAKLSPVRKSAIVSLREVTKDTVRIISLLDVAPGQEGLVAPNAFSMAEAHFHPEAWFRAIYADDTPVGFAMLEDWSQVTGREPELYEGAPYVALWRFMIDHRFQKLGFGAQAITLLIAQARTRPGAVNLLLSFVPNENNPEGFYKRFGFERTGEEDEGEMVMKLVL